MPRPEWEEIYQQGELPWDTGRPDPYLVDLVKTHPIAPCRAFEVGCGTGTNARWLAERGFDVLGVDLAPTAIETARARTAAGLTCRFEVLDFLGDATPSGPFDFAFDRGCFHVFDGAEKQAQFAARIAALLAPDGVWLSLIGSTEGAPRDRGPPRRSAREIMTAIEPSLRIVELRAIEFRDVELAADAWLCLSRRRSEPAQPSSRRED